jgi:hypothetical protein
MTKTLPGPNDKKVSSLNTMPMDPSGPVRIVSFSQIPRPMVAEIVRPCLTTVAIPLTLLTVAIGEEASAGETSPPKDKRRIIIAKGKTILFDLL